MAVGSTQPLTEINTRDISWEVKAAGAYGSQSHHLLVPIVLKSGNLNLPDHQGLSRPLQGLLYLFSRVVVLVNLLDFLAAFTCSISFIYVYIGEALFDPCVCVIVHVQTCCLGLCGLVSTA
jgi:hypothetical protein